VTAIVAVSEPAEALQQQHSKIAVAPSRLIRMFRLEQIGGVEFIFLGTNANQEGAAHSGITSRHWRKAHRALSAHPSVAPIYSGTFARKL
jgi:hypothetical protein